MILDILFQLFLQIKYVLICILPVILRCLLHLVDEVKNMFALLFQTIEIIEWFLKFLINCTNQIALLSMLNFRGIFPRDFIVLGVINLDFAFLIAYNTFGNFEIAFLIGEKFQFHDLIIDIEICFFKNQRGIFILRRKRSLILKIWKFSVDLIIIILDLLDVFKYLLLLFFFLIFSRVDLEHYF